MHTQEHVNFNASAQKYGHDVRSLEQITGRYIQFALKNFSIRQTLWYDQRDG